MSTPRAILAPSHARLNLTRAGEKYRPGNGTEGAVFFANWCCTCARDKAMRDGWEVEDCDDSERCDIIAKTMAYRIHEPQYPPQWQFGKDGQPCCTAYVPAGAAIPGPSAEALEAAGQARLLP